MSQKVLVIGGGFLGSHISESFKIAGLETCQSHFNQKINEINIDIRNIDSIQKSVLKLKPNYIVNCAAQTNIDFLEKNPDLAFSVNSDGAKNVAKISKENEIRLIHISTDSVFDGKKGMYSENDKTNPVNVYSKSKEKGEQLVMENSENCLVIRTNFYGYDKKKQFFFNWILEMLQKNNEIIGFDDVLFSPLEVSNLSDMICEIALKDHTGVLHLASDMPITKYQFALEVADLLTLNKNLIKKGSVDDIPLVAKRPKNTSLSNKKSKKYISTEIIKLQSWLEKIKNSL